MKTLTLTVSDKVAEGIAQAAAQAQRSEEDVATAVLEGAFDADWGDLSAEDVAAIEEGLADLEAGRLIPHKEIVAEFKARYGW